MRKSLVCMLAVAVLLGGPGCGDDNEGAKVKMSSEDLDSAIEQSHGALSEIIRGDAKGYHELFSERDDVTLGNPFGPFVRGRQKILETTANASTRYLDGEVLGFDLLAKHVSDDLACVVEIERYRAKVGGSDDLATIGLRVTSIFRPEDGAWKLVHRHADPITTPQATESIIPKQ